MREFISAIFSSSIGLFFFFVFAIGDLYWLWISIQIGSFVMFILGMIPPLVIVTGPVGAYSILFGVPDWVFSWFG